MSESEQALSKTLKAPVPQDFRRISDEHLAELETLLHRAIAHHDNVLDDAIRSSLEHAPRLLRPAVRKALGL